MTPEQAMSPEQTISAEQLAGLDESQMVNYQHPLAWSANSLKVHKSVVASLNQLCEKAYADGFKLALLSGYRSFKRQEQIWELKLSGQRPILDLHQNKIEQFKSDEDKFQAIARWSAIPGMSRHHWGTDLDIFDARAIEQGYQVELLPEEFSKVGPCFKLGYWLENHLQQFDFFRPYLVDNGGIAVEPWHISFKPLAQKITQQIKVETLQQIWQQHPCSWSDWVIANKEQLFQRYFLNQTPQSNN